MIRLSVLTFAAMFGLVGVAQAQSSSPPPLDPNGHPYVGSQNWHSQPGDFAREGQGLQPEDGMARGYHQQAMMPMDDNTAHAFAFKDEYGFRYDAQGNRLDSHGHVISPHNPNP
jgi:hypothetical protein